MGSACDHGLGVAVLEHVMLLRRRPAGVDGYRHRAELVDAKVGGIEVTGLIVAKHDGNLITAFDPNFMQTMGDAR
jgi:hypothetical protein